MISRAYALPAGGPQRVVTAAFEPSVDGGRYAVKRVLGDVLTVHADLVADGHDLIAARLQTQAPGGGWKESALTRADPTRMDRWSADVAMVTLGTWRFRVESWVDTYATWLHGIQRKLADGQDVAVELVAGALLLEAAATRAQKAGPKKDAAALTAAATALRDVATPQADRVAQATDPKVQAAEARHSNRQDATLSSEYPVVVERTRAQFSAWYEFFPRSFGAAGAHGTLKDAARVLPYAAQMGFDVVYLPPIHPIGTAHRKGPNNAATCQPSDPGSPWAIGGKEGGHTEIHPQLGTLEDFAALVARAGQLGMEVALDIAFQASPDHPWVKEHPDWFVKRPDGSIQYAENPPKKYQDVYPFDFSCKDWKHLWTALADVFFTWIERGVRIFRVDNPHTKPFAFWEWCIAAIRAKHPDVIFLAEAFARPLIMQQLAKLGFSQSYTYFTWRNSATEIKTYLTELTQTSQRHYFRPNFWPNTPDILPENLALCGRPMNAIRAVLASMLAANWGIYGPVFELSENAALPGREEYADSEKYQLRAWNLDAPHSLRHLLARLNKIRQQHPALQTQSGLHFHTTDNDALLCFSRMVGSDLVLCVVNLDPVHAHRGYVTLDAAALGMDALTGYQVHDLLGDSHFLWSGLRNYVELDPQVAPAHIFSIHRRSHREHGFEYFL